MVYGHGGDIYTYENMLDFSVNLNPLGPPQSVTDAAKRGVELVPVPAFSEYEQALDTVECEIKYYKTKENNCFCITEDFISELDESIDIVFLCSPVNPSGHVIDREVLLRVTQRCEELGIRLVLDECFIEFLPVPERYSMLRETERYHRLFILRAFTKIYAMPGLRLGYGLSSDDELLEKMQHMRQPWSVSVPAQEAGIAALQGSQDCVRAMAAEYDRRRSFLHERLCGIEGIRCRKGEGAFYLLPDVTDYLGREYNGKRIEDDLALAEFLLDKARVAVVPGSSFLAPGHLRITYAASMETLERAADAMEKALRLL